MSKLKIIMQIFSLIELPVVSKVKKLFTLIELLVVIAIIAILAAMYIGPEPALQAELYPTNIRSTALSISYNTATSVFGGTAPYIMESLVQNGNMGSGAIYIIVCAILSLIALYFYW